MYTHPVPGLFLDCSSFPDLNAQRKHCPLHPMMFSFSQVNLRVTVINRAMVWVRVRVRVRVRVNVSVSVSVRGRVGLGSCGHMIQTREP